MKKVVPCLLLLTLLLTACGTETASLESSSQHLQQESHPASTSVDDETHETEPSIATNPSESTKPTEDTEPTNGEEPDPYSMLRFLSDSNYVQVGGTPLDDTTPGALTPVLLIPQPDQQYVGTTVELALEQQMKNQLVHFLRDPQTEQECLTVMMWTDTTTFPLMMLLKTDFGDANVLLEHMVNGTVFQAEILAMVNITQEEAQLYAYNAVLSDYGVAKEEIVNVEESTELEEAEYIAGFVDSNTLHMRGICGENISQGLRSNLDVFWRIYARYEVTDLLPVNQPDKT